TDADFAVLELVFRPRGYDQAALSRIFKAGRKRCAQCQLWVAREQQPSARPTQSGVAGLVRDLQRYVVPIYRTYRTLELSSFWLDECLPRHKLDPHIN